MKKCPFCAEEIQPEAIKCRHCGSSLTGGGGGGPAAATADPAAVAAAQAAAQVAARRAADADPDKKLIYQGSPSWKAYFGQYLLSIIVALGVAYLAYWARGYFGFLKKKSSLFHWVMIATPLILCALYWFILWVRRRMQKVRVTNRSIEYDSGLIARKIEVMEMWRIRDIRYKQGVFDRILGIAHIELFTHDVTQPTFEIVGMPASRKLFEDIRDHIELSRQSRRVIGMID